MMRHECAIGPIMTWGIVVARKAVARSEALAEKVKKLEAQLEARERAQATESCPRAGIVAPRGPIQELDVIFYTRLTFRKDAWRACRRTAKQGSFVCREGITKNLFKAAFKKFEKKRDS